MENGRLCGEATEQDIKNAGYKCYTHNENYERGWYTAESSQILQWLIFDEAAKNQIDRNQCLKDMLDELYKNDKARLSLSNAMVSSWLGFRKTELLLGICSRYLNDQSKIPGSPRLTTDAEREKYKTLCEDEEKVNTLKISRTIFEQAIPVFSSSDILDFFRKHRDLIFSKNTKKPVTDQEILSANLQDLSGFSVDPATTTEPLKRLLLDSSQKSEREINNFSKSRNKAGTFNLSTQQRDNLYESGMVNEILAARGLIGQSEEGSASIKLRDKSSVSSGAVCLLAKYEPNLKAEVAEVLLEAAVLGGIYFKVAKGVIWAGNGGKDLLMLMLKGAALSNWHLPVNAFKACVTDKLQKNKMQSISDLEHDPQKTSNMTEAFDHLPEDVGYAIWDSIKMPNPKSCNSSGKAHYFTEQMAGSSCLIQAAFASTLIL